MGGTSNAAGRPLPGQKPDDFVDVYATHMQADELVCTSDAIETAVKNEVLIGLACSAVDPFMFAACLIMDSVLNSFHCDDFPDDQTVRDKQMSQMNAFIAATANRTRPAIVMGDFNTDTRLLNNDGTGHYGKILQQLHVGNVGSNPNHPVQIAHSPSPARIGGHGSARGSAGALIFWAEPAACVAAAATSSGCSASALSRPARRASSSIMFLSTPHLFRRPLPPV